MSAGAEADYESLKVQRQAELEAALETARRHRWEIDTVVASRNRAEADLAEARRAKRELATELAKARDDLAEAERLLREVAWAKTKETSTRLDAFLARHEKPPVDTARQIADIVLEEES